MFGEDFVEGMPTNDRVWWLIWHVTSGVWAVSASTNRVWRAEFTNNFLYAWREVAFCDKPQEFDLPLASGFTNADAGIKSRYSKDQMGQVFVDLAVSGSINANTITTIATLPAGFRPSYIAHSVAYRYTGQLPSIGLWVSVDGTVSCFSPENIEGLAGQILFIAAS